MVASLGRWRGSELAEARGRKQTFIYVSFWSCICILIMYMYVYFKVQWQKVLLLVWDWTKPFSSKLWFKKSLPFSCAFSSAKQPCPLGLALWFGFKALTPTHPHHTDTCVHTHAECEHGTGTHADTHVGGQKNQACTQLGNTAENVAKSTGQGGWVWLWKCDWSWREKGSGRREGGITRKRIQSPSVSCCSCHGPLRGDHHLWLSRSRSWVTWSCSSSGADPRCPSHPTSAVSLT